MRNLNILFMTEYFGDTVCISHLHYLEQAISKIANCRWAGPKHPRYIPKEPLGLTVKRVMRNAHWVIYYDFGVTKRRRYVQIPPKEPNRRSGRGRKYNVAAYTGDLQREPYNYREYLNSSGYDALLMAYIKTRKQIEPKRGKTPPTHIIRNLSEHHYTRGLNIPFFYTTPSIDTAVFKQRNEERTYDVTFLGALHRQAYPLRQHIWDELPGYARERGWNVLVEKSPPGRSLDRSMSNLREEHFVGDRYVEALAKSKIFIFGSSVFKYPLFKFFEGMACGACVMADTPLTAKELHLVPDWNFISINKGNWREKLKYYLRHDEEREEIARRGYETVMKYHTVNTRAKQVVNFLWKNM